MNNKTNYFDSYIKKNNDQPSWILNNNIFDLLNETPYKFIRQINFIDLNSLIKERNKELKWSHNEVLELLRNDIVTEAYIQGLELVLTYDSQDQNIWFSGSYTIDIDFWTLIEKDSRNEIQSPNGFIFHPHNILAYSRSSSDKMELLTIQGDFSIIKETETKFLDKLMTILSNDDVAAEKLDSVYNWNESEDLLIKHKIKIYLKE